MSAVPDRLQDSHHDIIHDKCDRSRKIYPEIYNGVWQHRLRRSHQYKNLGCQYHSDRCQDTAGHQTKCNIGMYCFFQSFIICCSKIFRNDNAGTNCNSIKKADHQKYQTAGRTDSCKSITAKKITDDQRIGGII